MMRLMERDPGSGDRDAKINLIWGRAMISLRSKLVLAILLVLPLCAAASWAQKQMGTEADKAAIKKSVAAWSGAWNRHDALATAMRYEADGDFSSMTAVDSHGRKELEEHYKTIFSGFLKNAQRKDTVRSIRFLTPDIASVDVDFEVTGALAPDGSVAPVRKGLLTLILTKRDGDWPITIYHEQSW